MPATFGVSRRVETRAALLVAALLSASAAPGQLTALGSALIDQCDGPDACEAEDAFGSSLAAGDFNGDGFADLAVGVPGEGTAGVAAAGMVEVFYGSPAGLPASADARFTQETSGISGNSESQDRFGTALAAGDVNLDGFADLAIGVPLEDSGDIVDSGVVYALFGSASGLSGSGALEYDQSNLPEHFTGCGGDVRESPEAGDRFGFSVAFAVPPTTGLARLLLIGVPGEDGFFPGQDDAGQLDEIIYLSSGAPRGLSCNRFEDQVCVCPGIDSVESGDSLGWSVAGRQKPTSNPDDIVGVPFEETVSGVSNSGVVLQGNSCLQQNGPMLDSEESGDRFGGALVTGDFDDDGFQDLAIGVAGESRGSASDAGAVAVVFADVEDNLDTPGNQLLDQNLFQPDAAAASGNHFGSAIAAGDFDGDGATDLAIGASDADVSGHADAGSIHVLYSDGLVGLSSAGAQTFDQDFPVAVPSIAEPGDHFGSALAAGDFDGNGTADLAIGVPGEGGVGAHVGIVNLLYGLERSTGAFGEVTFTTGALTVNEGTETTVLIADRSGGAVLAASVDHLLNGGTATSGIDFNYTPGTFTWDAGDLTTDIKVLHVVDDTTDEPNETFRIALAHPSPGLKIGAHPEIVITIVDNDPPGQLFVDGFETGNTTKWSVAVP